MKKCSNKIYKNIVNINSRFPLSIEMIACNTYEDIALHTHDFCEIGITLRGSATHYIDIKKFLLQRGSVYIIPKGESHRILINDSWSVINIYFLPELLEENIGHLISLYGMFPLAILNLLKDRSLLSTIMSEEYLDSTLSLIDCINKYPLQQSWLQTVYNKNCFMNILMILSHSHKDFNSYNLDSRIIDIIMLIHNNIHLELKTLIEIISKNKNLSSHYINTIFSKCVNTTISSYIIKAKILRSCSMLLNNNNVTDVALTLGFYDHSHYIKYFKKIMGVSPTQYIQKYTKVEKA